MFADILILRPESNLDQILTYRIGACPTKIVPGIVVKVPVRQRTERGIVLRIFSEPPTISRIRAIEEVLPYEMLSPESLKTAQWLSEYYLCSLNKAVHLFLPPPVRQKQIKVLVLGDHDSKEHLLLGETEKAILSLLKEKDNTALTLRELTKLFGADAKTAVSFLLNNRLIRTEKKFVPVTEVKKKTLLELSNEAPNWQELQKKAPRQATVLRAIQGGITCLEELREIHGINRSVIKPMLDKGWIVAKQVVQRRNPVSGLMASSRPQRLNCDQESAVIKISDSIKKSLRKNWLLFGVTGSGKTEVYLKAIEQALSLGRQILYLVPEIALTPQITTLLINTFGDGVAVLHSAMSSGERHDEWLRIKHHQAQVVIGPRSAVFAPFKDLGLIIIDEEHENTYKQNEPDPRYDARTVALKLAELFGAVLIRGSATPALFSYYAVSQGFYELINLPHRVASRPLPVLKTVDMKTENQSGNNSIFSRYLLEKLGKIISAGEQAILFINRRGYHTYVMCRECGSSLNCPRCLITLTYHQSRKKLVCHYCNYQMNIPKKCSFCGSNFLHYVGTGSERVATELKKQFPEVGITRIDTDTTKQKGSHYQLLKEFEQGKTQVLIGTQMIAKGLDFPNVTLVGIINADILVNLPEYQSGERAYQLITQVAGRAGRGEKHGEVIIQTYSPEHYVFKAAARHDYEEFYRQELENRRLLYYPPFHYLVRILVSGHLEKNVLDRIEYICSILIKETVKDSRKIEMFGPTPAPLYHLKGRFRYHLLLKGDKLGRLRELAAIVRDEMKATSLEPRVIIDVEPLSLL